MPFTASQGEVKGGLYMHAYIYMYINSKLQLLCLPLV